MLELVMMVRGDGIGCGVAMVIVLVMIGMSDGGINIDS
jgi:hypothetical protein